jgi:hypothetical protein
MQPPNPEPEQNEPISNINVNINFNMNSYKNRINILKPNTQRSLGASYNMFYNSSTINTNPYFPYFNNNSILEEVMHITPNNTLEVATNPITEQLTEQLTDQLNIMKIGSGGISRTELYKYVQRIQIAIPFECPVCLNTHNTGTEYLAIKCGHIFCTECSIKWFECKPLCPLCKCDIRY